MTPGVIQPNQVLSDYQLAEILGFKQDFKRLVDFLQNLQVESVEVGGSTFYPTNPIILAFERAAQKRWVSGPSGGLTAIPAEPEVLITKQETARLLSVEPRTVDRWVQKGKLTKKYLGNEARFIQSEVTALAKTEKEKS